MYKEHSVTALCRVTGQLLFPEKALPASDSAEPRISSRYTDSLWNITRRCFWYTFRSLF